jgi:hypothetical protein
LFRHIIEKHREKAKKEEKETKKVKKREGRLPCPAYAVGTFRYKM